MAFPTTGILDTFNRAGPGLGTDWTAPLWFGDNVPEITGNQLYNPLNTYADAYWDLVTFGPASEAYLDLATLPGAGNLVYLNLRIVNPGAASTMDGYEAHYLQQAGTDILRIFRIDNTVGTQLGADISLDFAAGDGFGFEANGSTLTIYRRSSGTWSSAGSRTDSTYTADGYIGCGIQETTARGDNFGGGTLIVAADMPPLAANAQVYEPQDLDLAGFLFWLTPDDVLPEAQPIAAELSGHDITYEFPDDTLYNWISTPLSDDFVDVMPPAPEWSAADLDYIFPDDAAHNWLQAPLSDDLIEQPIPLPEFSAADLSYIFPDDTPHNWLTWQMPADVLPEDFMPSALLVLAEAEIKFDDSPHNWTVGPNSLAALPGFTRGLITVTTPIKGTRVTTPLKRADVTTPLKGVEDGTTS